MKNLIKTDNYLFEVDDKDFSVGSKVLHKESIYTVKQDTGDYLKVEEYSYIGIRKDLCKKILSHLPLNEAPHLDGVDVFPPNWRDNVEEDDIEYKYTEKDIRRAIDMARGIKEGRDTFTAEDVAGCTEVCTYGWKYEFSDEEIIQSLQQLRIKLP